MSTSVPAGDFYYCEKCNHYYNGWHNCEKDQGLFATYSIYPDPTIIEQNKKIIDLLEKILEKLGDIEIGM